MNAIMHCGSTCIQHGQNEGTKVGPLILCSFHPSNLNRTLRNQELIDNDTNSYAVHVLLFSGS